MSFNGVHMNLGNIMKLSNAVTRSITAENVYGEKAKGGMADMTQEPQPEVAQIGQAWDDIASVAYWYQSEPHMSFAALGTREELEVI